MTFPFVDVDGVTREKKGGATQWVKVPTQQKPATVKLRRRAWSSESRVRCLLTNPALGWKATLWAAGIER
jgi:hypothetical protein